MKRSSLLRRFRCVGLLQVSWASYLTLEQQIASASEGVLRPCVRFYLAELSLVLVFVVSKTFFSLSLPRSTFI